MILLNHIALFKYFFTGLIWLGLIASAHGVPLEKIKSELALARENLRIIEATAVRIDEELEELKKSGQASHEIINDYETYLARVQAMVDENHKVVKAMETAYARHFPETEINSPDDSEQLKDMLDPKIPEEEAIDAVAALDQELNNSLANFDEVLLKEFELIRARSERKLRDLAEEAAEAAKRLREKGVDLEATESEFPSETGEDGAERMEKAHENDELEEVDKTVDRVDAENDGVDGLEKGSHTKEGEIDEGVATSEKSSNGGQGSPREQAPRYDNNDDDIVARQLREAAENEKDPELKEKLWKEYEEYKENTR
jgi:hypothetical protein